MHINNSDYPSIVEWHTGKVSDSRAIVIGSPWVLSSVTGYSVYTHGKSRILKVHVQRSPKVTTTQIAEILVQQDMADLLKMDLFRLCPPPPPA